MALSLRDLLRRVGAAARRARSGPHLAPTTPWGAPETPSPPLVATLATPAPSATPAPDFPFTAEDCVAAADRALGEERWSQAIEWLERARRLAPTSSRVCSDLAFAYERCGLRDEALRLYDEAARLAPNPSEPLFHGAVLALRSGRVPEAGARLDRALALDPALADELETPEWDRVRPAPRRGGHRDDEDR